MTKTYLLMKSRGSSAKETGKKLRELSLSLHTEGAEFAETRGIIIADTKFEFGIDQEGKIMWIDER